MFTITPCHLQWHRLTLPHQNTHHITTIQCQNSQMGQQLMFTQLTPELWVSPPSSYNLFLPASPCLRPALITACHPLTSHHRNSAIQLAHTWGNNHKQIRSSFPIYNRLEMVEGLLGRAEYIATSWQSAWFLDQSDGLAGDPLL